MVTTRHASPPLSACPPGPLLTILLELTDAEVDRMAVLMDKYRDTPMDLADASLVAVAERRSLRRVFALDSHFRIYRLLDGSALEIVP